jgi:MORN repeat
MRVSIYASVLLIAAAHFAGAAAFGQQLAMAPAQKDCPWDAPDSLQISWTQPCEEGDWLLDTQLGCRMWDWHPDTQDRAVWSGACPGGKKDGRGIAQWFEHGQRIDRFEGNYRNGKREGFGRYVWNEETSFEGQYANDVPHGFGTATVVGETFAGDWKNGCFRKDGHVVAIGVARTSCSDLAAQVARPQRGASF